MSDWITCHECGTVLFADHDDGYFCTVCDGYDPDKDYEDQFPDETGLVSPMWEAVFDTRLS